MLTKDVLDCGAQTKRSIGTKARACCCTGQKTQEHSGASDDHLDLPLTSSAEHRYELP